MSTTTIVVIIAIVIALGILGAVLVARTRRRQAQASARMGLPDLGTLSGEPIDKVTATRAATDREDTIHSDTGPSGGGPAKPQPEQ